ncbi:hypothetical protein DFH07DRAFT_928493 [Mycena maculata]|uniref:Uncharacterized protein n=1 Tax=Mycena maculata TaxID=230809 RepID=A0AAD7I5D7_9AGAR|nr:hypothetical protein DFH07DRAFT_928493 [Mycena maculata]
MVVPPLASLVPVNTSLSTAPAPSSGVASASALASSIGQLFTLVPPSPSSVVTSASTVASSTRWLPANASLGAKSPTLNKRAAIPACLDTVELSCLNLAANCINTVDSDTMNDLWGISSCVAAATCYGVGNLITSVECQTGFSITDAGQASLDYDNIYAGIVGSSCAFAPGGCPITQQNYIDFYYGTLTAIDTANYPSSSAVVIVWWDAITAWAATGSTVPYLNFNDWLHFSSFPSVTTTTAPPVASYTQITWNPNPAPPSGAASETFVSASSTLVIAIPTTTTTVVIVGASITLAPGGTPVNGPVPSGVSQPGATTPTWNPNIIPPTSVASVTFTAPPSYTSVVAVPTASNSPPQNITGPPGDKNSNGDDWWLLLFPGIIGGLLPADIGIPGGILPTAAPPAGWVGPWTDPDPTSSSTSTSTSSASTSASSSSSCPQPTSVYALSDDSENADWEDEGTDPDRRRNTRSKVAPRADPRSIAVNSCSLSVVNTVAVSLGPGTYYSIGLKALGGTGATLTATQVGSRPVGNGAGTVAQEHIFELGYINQFFTVAINAGITCAWIETNVFNFVREDSSNLGIALLNAIDQVGNMVWVDKPMNQAKSNVVNQNKASAASPPQSTNINMITDFTTSANLIQDVEYFTRNFAALGSYFGATAATFQATALRVQNLLAEITPTTPDANLPVEFNNWLRGLIATYPTGCTSRATNVFNFYQAKMNSVSATIGAPVPACFPLYHSTTYNPQSFAWANLIPPAPTLPACDIPGTQGQIQLGLSTTGTPIMAFNTYRIMGSGNTNYYAFGDGASLVGSHFVGQDLSTLGPSCQGVWDLGLQTGPSGNPDANIALNCNGQSGNDVAAPFTFVINNQQLGCVTLNSGVADGGGVDYYVFCGATVAAAATCATAYQQANFPQGSLLGGSLQFVP